MHSLAIKLSTTAVGMGLSPSLVPRPLQDFISQPWRKIGRRPGIKTTSRTGNGGLGQYIMWTRFVLTKSTISGPWRSFDPMPSPDFSPRLRDKIWEGPGDEATCHLLTGLLPWREASLMTRSSHHPVLDHFQHTKTKREPWTINVYLVDRTRGERG